MRTGGNWRTPLPQQEMESFEDENPQAHIT